MVGAVRYHDFGGRAVRGTTRLAGCFSILKRSQLEYIGGDYEQTKTTW